MKITTRKSEQGIAIIIVMISIFVLAMLAGAFAFSMKIETKLAMNSNNESEMEWVGRSGIELARYVLGQTLLLPGPGNRYDALNQKWAGGSGETNETLAAISMQDVPLGHGKFSVKITDNERKFNINSVPGNEAVLQEALIMMGADAAVIPAIIGSIQDWIDPDDEMHLNGTESRYYETLEPPYLAKNGAIDDMTELLLIRGISPDIFWGANAANHPTSTFQSRGAIRPGVLAGAAPVTVGLVDLFTPVSIGAINLNTTTANALRLLGIDPVSADRLISMRQGLDGVDGTEDDAPFSNPGEIVNVVPNQFAQSIMRYLTVRSSTFEVRVDVEIGTSRRRYFATLRRNSGRDVQILNMYWKEGERMSSMETGLTLLK